MEKPLEDIIYNWETLAKWLETKCEPDLVISKDDWVTVRQLAGLAIDLAYREWSDGIDAMGEDA